MGAPYHGDVRFDVERLWSKPLSDEHSQTAIEYWCQQAREAERKRILALIAEVRDKPRRSLDWCNACNEIAAKLGGEG